MGKFSFKSSGKASVSTSQQAESKTPIGIKTPLVLSNNSGLLDMHYDLADQVHDNLRNFLLTNWGERLGLYDFGANLRPITTELVSQDDFDNEAIQRIRSSVSKWMPYVDLENFESITNRDENKNTGIIDVTITYNVPALNVRLRRLQVRLYVI